MNYKQALIKYVAHVAAAEGESYALSTNLAPCGMLDMEFTEEDVSVLKEIFTAVREYELRLKNENSTI